jgi:glycosyltransferase 2 family protein
VLMLFAMRPAFAHWIVDKVMRLLPFLERFHLRSLTDRVLDGLAPLGSVRGLLGITLWTALAWIGSIIAGYLLMYVFYDTPNWTAVLLIIASASVAIAIPAAPGSVGPFELAVILGLSAGGMIDANNPQEKAFAFAIFLHLINVFCYAATGMIGLGQERISFGEVIRLAQQLVGKKAEPTEESAPISSTP